MAAVELIIEMLKDPPDPNEPLPVMNRKATIYGLTITSLVSTFLLATAALLNICLDHIVDRSGFAALGSF